MFLRDISTEITELEPLKRDAQETQGENETPSQRAIVETPSEIDIEHQEMKAAETQTEIQKEPHSGSHCKDETEVASDSMRNKKSYYCKKFFRSFFYEMYWSALVLLVFYVFQPQCK